MRPTAENVQENGSGNGKKQQHWFLGVLRHSPLTLTSSALHTVRFLFSFLFEEEVRKAERDKARDSEVERARES